MKKNGKSNHIRRNIVLGILLAVVCIGAAELAACRYFEPELYERIVAPARYAAAVTVDAGRTALNALADAGQAALNAAGQFCRDTASAISRMAARAGEQAAAFWAELTAPKPSLSKAKPPSASSEPAPATPPPITELLEADGRQILTGGIVDVTYFRQSSPEWADQPYGTDTIGPYGCGPTVMAIAVASLTDTKTNPAVMAQWAAANGHWASRAGSYHSIILAAARSFGITAEPFTNWDAEGVLRALRSGKMLVALVGPGHFTTGGHFLLLRGATADGKVLVADPNSVENSLTLWDPQLIIDELSPSRDYGAPLWALWTPEL